VNGARFTLPVRWRVFAAAVAILLVVTLWLRGTAPPAPRPRPEPTPRSIAVIPFMNASPDSAYDYLGAGLGGDLTGVHGRIPGLRVAGERSAAALAGEDPVTIGRRLRVSAVLFGTIRPVTDRLRLSAHLVSVDGGFDIWSEAYERGENNLYNVEGDIVGAVITALKLRSVSTRPPDPPALRAALGAHNAYLEGRWRLSRRELDAAEYAAAGFERAISLDSSYAPAWAGAAAAYLRGYLTDSSPPEEAIPRARRAVERAIALDSTMAEAWIARAVIELLYDREPRKAGTDLDRALSINPNLAEAWDWQAHQRLALGMRDGALAAARRAVDTSPLDPVVRAHLGWQYFLAGQDSLADLAISRAQTLDAAAVIADGRVAWRTAPPADSAAYDSLVQVAREKYVSPYALAIAAVASGKRAQAVAALRRAMAERAPWAVYARVDPRLASLRRDRAFEALLARLPQTTIPAP
jgi:eukaryotic-like serine/threonine-protein kinase